MSIFSREAAHSFWLPWLLATTISLVVFSGWMLDGYSRALFGIPVVGLGFIQWLIVRYGQARWWKIIAGSVFAIMVFMFAAVIVIAGPDDHEIAMHLIGVLIYGIPLGLLHGSVFAIVAWTVRSWSSAKHIALDRNTSRRRRAIALGVLGPMAVAILFSVVFIIVFRSIFWGQGSKGVEVAFSPNGRFLG